MLIALLRDTNKDGIQTAGRNVCVGAMAFKDLGLFEICLISKAES